MIAVRKSEERGHFDHGWLQTYHTFSFGDYYDPKHMGFQALRAMNEDRVSPTQGFGMHAHKDMEIVTYVLEGRLQHLDSMGNGSVLGAGDFQRMTAGSGVRHSEFNPSDNEPLHLYQIWLLPEKKGLEPGYQERRSAPGERSGGFRLVASRDGRGDSLVVHQDADIFLASLENGEAASHDLQQRRHAWLQVMRGEVEIGGRRLAAGDGASATDERLLAVKALSRSEVMLFDLS